MNKDLEQLMIDYATKEHPEINVNLLGKSKDNLISILTDLLTMYFNDLNSSTMREIVVALIAGYVPNLKKLGYNGFRHNTLTGKTEHCEIKPRNYRTDSTAKSPSKLNGGGNFTDYTLERFKKHQRENPKMLIGGFVDGHLIFIVGFNFNEQNFTFRLEEQLKRQFPSGRKAGEYKRSVEFTFKHYKDVESLETIHIAPIQELIKAKPYITGPVFNYLEKNAK